MHILITRILGVIYGLISLIFILSTTLPRAWSHGAIVFALTLPLIILSILLLLPYARLAPRTRHIALVGLCLVVAYSTVTQTIALFTVQKALASSPEDAPMGGLFTLVIFFTVGSITILLAQPLAIYLIGRKPPAPTPLP